MKKIIAFVLTVAMVLSVCAFSVSAETAAPSVELQGATNAVVGDTYTVSVRLNDAAGIVAGVQGEIAYTNATVKGIVVNPQLQEWNNTEDNDTIVHDDGDSVNFATLTKVTGTRLLVKITFTVQEGATFTLENYKFSDADAKPIDNATAGATLAPAVAATEEVSIVGVGMLPKEVATQQGVVVRGKVVAEDVKEIGVLFYPTQLLGGKALTIDNKDAVSAVATENLENILAEEEGFDGVLNFNLSEAAAAKLLGVKITSVVYYKDSKGNVTYSSNNIDGNKYVKNGVASKAILNTALDVVNGITDKAEELTNALADLDGSNYIANRNTVLKYAVQAANAQ